MTFLSTARLATCLSALLSILAMAESRTWTSADGRTIEAELVSLEEDGVLVLRASDRKRMKLTPEMLSPVVHIFPDKL